MSEKTDDLVWLGQRLCRAIERARRAEEERDAARAECETLRLALRLSMEMKRGER